MNEFTADAETQRVSWLPELIEHQLMSSIVAFLRSFWSQSEPRTVIRRLSEAEGDLVAVLLSLSAEHC